MPESPFPDAAQQRAALRLIDRVDFATVEEAGALIVLAEAMNKTPLGVWTLLYSAMATFLLAAPPEDADDVEAAIGSLPAAVRAAMRNITEARAEIVASRLDSSRAGLDS